MPILTLDALCEQAKSFSTIESAHPDPSLFGVTDGKAVGTYLEHKFRRALLSADFEFVQGNSASGIDFPELNVDMKVTSIKQPQSSCPFKSARQKIYGLGYALIIFVYDKVDDEANRTALLRIGHTILVEKDHTADFQMTSGLLAILGFKGNADDIRAFLMEKNLPVDEIELNALAEEILRNPPRQGYLTISNALQWRLQYSRVIEKAGSVAGIRAVHQQ